MAASWNLPTYPPCPSDDVLRSPRPGTASALDDGNGCVKEDARDGFSRVLHAAASHGRMPVCVYLCGDYANGEIIEDCPEIVGCAWKERLTRQGKAALVDTGHGHL